MKHFIITCLLALIALYGINIKASEPDDDDDVETSHLINGQVAIFLDDDIQKNAGIETLTLKEIQYHPESIAYGKALSILPLLSTLKQYFSASAQQAGAKARFTQAKRNNSRLRTLHKNAAVSTRKLQNQQSQWQSDQAIYKEMAYQSQLIINTSKLEWGETLINWAIDKQASPFDLLMKGQATLLKMTLPAGSQLPAEVSSINISPTGNRSVASIASLVSVLPQVDSFSQGLQYLFITTTPGIKAGMNFTAWIPQQKQAQPGFIIPESSLAWHLGVAFVFIQVDEEHFIHRNISHPIKVAEGYFISGQLSTQDELVVTGTQMLLSHEFKSQIPDEDDD